MNGQDIYEERAEVKKILSNAPRKIYENGIKYAEAQMNYRLAMKEAMLKRRDEGMPVGLVEKVARGDVAKEEYDMVVCEYTVKASEEAANVNKRLLDSIEATIKREIG